MKIDELVGKTTGQDLLFVKVGEQAVLVPLAGQEPIIKPDQIEGYGVATLEQRRALVVLICSRIVGALISDQDRARIESFAEAALSGTKIEDIATIAKGT
jgi:hypothetical protein